MIIDCEEPVLIFEQLIYDLQAKTTEHLTRLLQMNRNLLHGAFVISEEGATAGVDVRGGAPGTRETDLLNPVNLVVQVSRYAAEKTSSRPILS